MSTKQTADRIVYGLGGSLANADLPSICCVYVSGSYCRGDWLDRSSDLDIGVIQRETEVSAKERDISWLHEKIRELMGAEPFPSQCPDGVDFSLSPESAVPKTPEEAAAPSPYPPFSSTLFDLRQHHITLYGSELSHILPEPPEPKESARVWVGLLGRRLEQLPEGSNRAMFLAYKAVTAAQIFFGEATLSKYRMLELYQRNVPEFSGKPFGEMLIRNYLGSFYPERPPLVLGQRECLEFVREIEEIIRRFPET